MVLCQMVSFVIFFFEIFLKSCLIFGSKLLLSGLLETIYTNLYTLVIGKKILGRPGRLLQ